mmetsp:Transcript_47926/g.133626  ORF Transcript_47926/g.133626 Transcript_47926/m.133626 type:complete len:227 (+) Transcript_47926:2881-3561(+)
MLIVVTGTSVSSLFAWRISSAVGMCLSKRPGRFASSISFSRVWIHDSTNGAQPTSASLIKRMPARDTVAGVAFLSEWISKIMRIDGVSGMRSFETRVSTLLSSITVFIDSIHTASISPSRTTHLAVWFAVKGAHSLDMLRMTIERQPSFQSFERVMKPYSSSEVTALGFTPSNTVTGLTCPTLWHAASAFQTVDLPQPAGPSSMTEWRTCRISWYCMTFETKISSV